MEPDIDLVATAVYVPHFFPVFFYPSPWPFLSHLLQTLRRTIAPKFGNDMKSIVLATLAHQMTHIHPRPYDPVMHHVRRHNQMLKRYYSQYCSNEQYPGF